MPIFDQGYQHWDGELHGRVWRWWAITRQGLRAGFKHRGMRTVLYLAWMPAFLLVGMLCVWGLVERQSEYIKFLLSTLESVLGRKILEAPRAYRVEVWTITYHYFMLIELWYAMLLILMVGPNLISQDLRFNALPLYFSRPLRRIDYFIGKLGVITVFLGMIVILPSIIAYLFGLLFSLDISILRDTFRLLLASILYGLIIAVSGGLIILAFSSLSRNSRYVSAFWIAFLLLGSLVSATLAEVNRQDRPRRGSRLNVAELAAELKASETDWRPVVSYTANLRRIGQYLLGTDEAWERISESWPDTQRVGFLSMIAGPQYPWFWSAIVLAVLFLISACILKFQVKTLDRLK